MRFEAEKDEEAWRSSLLLACTVADCDGSTYWRLFRDSLSSGDAMGCLAHFSALVMALPRSIHRIGGGLGLSVLALLGIGFGSILFLVLVISRHAYVFGTAVSGRLPYMSAPVYAICPVLVPVMLILAGYGVISLVVGVGMVLPLVKRREAIWTFVAVIFLWQLTGEPPRSERVYSPMGSVLKIKI